MIGSPIRSGVTSVATALPWCCIAPAALAGAGLATAGVGATLMQATPLFLIVSVAFLGRALHLAFAKRHGSLCVRLVVLAFSLLVVALWLFGFGLFPT